MRFYFNEVSVQGQFEDAAAFFTEMEALLAARRRSPFLMSMRTTPVLADRPATPNQTVRQVFQAVRGSPAASLLLAWVGKTGPFIDEERLAEAEDLFLCLGIDVTDGGLGEAARRCKALDSVCTMSFSGGDPDFGRTPLLVSHGFEDQPLASYHVDNHWTAQSLIDAALTLQPLPTNWRGLVEAARERFANLLLPDTIFEDRRLAREPFDAVIRDRVLVLLGILDRYVGSRSFNGAETDTGRDIINQYFTGDRALFSAESASNQSAFVGELTFQDPSGGPAIFAHWHGKISHRYFRLHFEWPVPAQSSKLKVLYIGPKLTKS